MKKSLLTMLMLLVATTALLAQPKIEIVGGDVIDWKDSNPKNSPLKADVYIKNAGNQTLKISEVKPTCGCTTAPLDKYELAPGEQTLMKVTLNITSYSGKVTKSIRVSSNDPNAAVKMVTLKTNVIRPIEIKPTTYFTFNDMKVGVESSAKVFIKNSSDKPITISDFKTEPEGMRVNINGKKTIKPGEEVELIGTMKPQKTGYINPKVTFKTSHPDMPDIEVRGYGNVKESAIFNSK